MSIHLKVSNSLQSLSEELSKEIRNTTSVFRPIYVVTQTEGMNRWLKLQLAHQIGISANIEFLKPNDIIHLAYRHLGGKFNNSISAHDMTWLLYQALGEKEFIQNHKILAGYYLNSPLDAESKRMALAEKIADLFDQYQVYRTDLIKEWNENKSETTGEAKWQKALWLRVKELAGESFPDKTMVGNFIKEALNSPENQENLQQNLPKVYFFGLSLITDYHLSLVHYLSHYISIHFLIQNPAPNDYWYEEKNEKVLDYLKRKGIYPKEEVSQANPLLIGWGKLIQDTFMMLFKDEQTLNNYEEIKLIEPPKAHLLNHIQNTIFHNEKENIEFSDQQIQDGSITINSCYSPVREVEVLYNYLIHLLVDKKESLSARDIVVMVSDIDMYSSYIRAVFDNSPFKFKYTIADESYTISDCISNTLLSVLSLNEAQFTSERVVSLLDFSSLRKQFQITDISRIRKWVDAANIRFGMDGNRADDSDYVSWNYGLKRMMYGLCMSGEQEFGNGETSFYPLDAIEGFDMFQATHFVYFIENLMESIQNRKTQRTVAEWVKYVEETLRIFIGEREENEDEDYNLLLNQLEKYNLLQEIFTQKVSYEVFLHNFKPILSNATRTQAFAGSGITFCSLIPMRSIPFKVVALLGMNFDKFPRKDNRLSFDLMNLESRLGDRNIKENDKHLFLETLLSAENYLYISYIGQSLKDNTSLPPSVLVDELVDFIFSNSSDKKLSAQNFISKHPLHGFSKKYNSSENHLYSYLLSNPKEEIIVFKEKEETQFDFKEISVSELIAFFKNPIKSYHNRVLKVFYEQDELSLRETEYFDLDNLQKWKFRNDLLHLDEETVEEFRQKEVKLGNLPLKNKSKVDILNLAEELEILKKNYKSLTEDYENESIEVNLKFENTLLTGKINGIFNENIIRYSFSKSDYKYRFEAYLNYLIAKAMGIDLDVKFLSINSSQIHSNEISISQEEAMDRLNNLVELYKKGHQEILIFDFSLSQKKNLKNFDQKEFNDLLSSYFDNSKFPCWDAHHVKEYRNGLFHSENCHEEFYKNVELVLSPTLEFLPV